MKRLTLFRLLIAGLIVTNLLLALFILLKPGSGPPHKRPREIIIKRLHFTAEQVRAYDELIDWHRSEIQKTDEQILELKTRLYSGIAGTLPGTADDSLIAKIGQLQMYAETVHYKHFEDIRALCTPEQLPDFEALLEDIATLFSKPRPGPPPR